MPIQLSRTTWVAGLLFPLLPDAVGDEEVEADLRRGYRALAEAVARVPAGDCAVQVRLESVGSGDLEAGLVRCLMILRARSAQDCAELVTLAHTTLSTRLSPQPIADEGELRALLRGPFGPDPLVCSEIRRLADDVGPMPGIGPGGVPDIPAIVRWAPDPTGLRQAATLLARRPQAGLIVLHMEPVRPSPQLLDHLDGVIRDIAAEQDVASSPLRAQVVGQYRARLRDLPRAALQLRVVLVTQGRPSPALEAATGIALAEEGGFQVRTPTTDRQALLLTDLVERLEAGRPGPDVLDELAVIADTAEAAGVVRLPVPAPAGTVGLASAPVATLPRAAEPSGSAGVGSLLRIGIGAGGGTVALGVDELKQHLVVAGLPGFGKTLTTQTLLAGVWAEGVPFLVIDPAKSDYRALASVVPGLRVVSLTPDDFAFNPFGVPQGCDRVTHAGRVLAAFDAAFNLSREWPVGYVTLARALYRAYEDEAVPTLASLHRHLAAVMARSKFQGPDGANIRASLLGRVEFLARGPLGVALSAPSEAAIDFADVVSQPTLIELRRFAGPMERSLVFALLLAGLISYRESNPVYRALGHVTVLEEAHRLLRRGQDGPASEGVRMFIEAIAELRGSGEGIIVVDQAPTMLDPGVMKLAGSMLTHRLVDEDERTAVGAALMLDAAQSRDLGRLETGEVVVHSPHRKSSVAAMVQPPEALLRATPTLPHGSSLQTRLPWLPQAGDEKRRVLLAERVTRLGQASEWLSVYTELASDLAATRPSPLTWRQGLTEIEEAIRAEVAQRTRGATHE